MPPASFASAPSDSRIRAMKRVSLKSGTRRMTHGSPVSNVAAMMGRAAFLLPLMVISPCNGTPPLIKKLSMLKSVPGRDAALRRPVGAARRPGRVLFSCNQDSGPVRVVFLHGFDNPLFSFKYFPDGPVLAVAEFQHDFAIRFQKGFCFLRQPPVEIQAVHAAVQRRAWVKIADFGLERGNFGGRNVRGIADNQVE